MGMFDNVINDGNLVCSQCGEELTGLQSKNGECTLANLTIDELFDRGGDVISVIGECGNDDCSRKYQRLELTKPVNGYFVRNIQ